MRAGADEVQAVHVLAAVVGTEPGALPEKRRQAEAGTVVGEQAIAEVQGGGHLGDDHVLLEIGEQRVGQRLGDAAAEGFGLGRPVGLAQEVGHGCQHVEAVASFGRHRRVARRRSVEVEAEVVRELLVLEDVLDQPLVARPQADRVMRHVVVAAVGAEVPDEEAVRVGKPVDACVGPLAARALGQEVAVGPGDVGVGDDDVGVDHLAALKAHALGGAAVDQDLRDRALQAERAALTPDQAREAVHELAGAAHDIVDAAFTLEIGDERVDARRAERVTADEERVEAQDEAEPLVLHVAGDVRVDRAVAAQPHHAGRTLRHVPDAVEGLVAQLLEADAVDRLAGVQEPLVAGDVVRAQRADLRAHALVIAGAVEGEAVVKTDPVEWIHRDQRDVVGHLATTERPQLLEAEERGDDARTGVEGVAVLVELVAAAAGLIEPVDDGDPIAARAEADRGGEPAEAGADDDGVGTAVAGDGGGGGRTVECCQHGLTSTSLLTVKLSRRMPAPVKPPPAGPPLRPRSRAGPGRAPGPPRGRGGQGPAAR